MTEPRWLNADEQRAWRAYLRMVLLLDAEVARDLTRDSGLSMPDYHVLAAVSEAPDHRRRLSELANSIQWSASRLSHHVSRMQQRGLVTRAECSEDGRGAFVVITDKGMQAIRDAAPQHVESVRKNLIDVLSADQIKALTAISETVIAHFGDSCRDNYLSGASQSENRSPVSRS
jgi:DNA-binding MarR family transcriptional regulator